MLFIYITDAVYFPGDWVTHLGYTGSRSDVLVKHWDPGNVICAGYDVEGNGTYKLAVTDLEPGSYYFKVAIGGSWDVNYGRHGKKDGENIRFDVLRHTDIVTLRFDAGTHTPSFSIAALEGT